MTGCSTFQVRLQYSSIKSPRGAVPTGGHGARDPLVAVASEWALRRGRAARGLPREAYDTPDYERWLATARARFDPASFAAAWAEGEAMSLEQAVAYALAEEIDSRAVGGP